MGHEMQNPVTILESSLGDLGYGTPIYSPSDPPETGMVTLGDVGCIYYGRFYRAFNAAHPKEHEINKLGYPPGFEPLRLRDQDAQVTYMEAGTVIKKGLREQKPIQDTEDDERIKTHTFSLRHWSVVGFTRGAFMCLSDRSKVVKLADAVMNEWATCFVAHHKNWLDWSREIIQRPITAEGLVMVTGYVLTPRWAIVIAEGSGQFSIQYQTDVVADARILKQSGNVDVECYAGYGRPDLDRIPEEEMDDYVNGLHIVPRVANQIMFVTGMTLSKAKSIKRRS